MALLSQQRRPSGRSRSQQENDPNRIAAQAMLAAQREKLVVSVNKRSLKTNKEPRKSQLFSNLFLKGNKKHSTGYQIDGSGPALPGSLLDRASFEQLKLFARKHHIQQSEVNILFESFSGTLRARTHPDGAHKALNKVSTVAFQNLFRYTLSENASQILVPFIFIHDAHGLPKPRLNDEIDFARFLIAGYTFAKMSPAALFLYFFRMILDYAMCSPNAYIPLRPFEELVGLLHAGLSKPILALFSEAFDFLTYTKFPDLIRTCISQPILLLPLLHFQEAMRAKFFGHTFWVKHANPCLNPITELLFDSLRISPHDEIRLTSLHGSRSAAWHLTALRLVSIASISSSSSSHQKKNAQLLHLKKQKKRKSCWRTLKVFENNSLSDYQWRQATEYIRDRHGYRLAHFFLSLARSEPIAQGALFDTLPPSLNVRLHIRSSVNGNEFDPATTRCDDGTFPFTEFYDMKTRRNFYYNADAGLATWIHPKRDFLFGNTAGEKAHQDSTNEGGSSVSSDSNDDDDDDSTSSSSSDDDTASSVTNDIAPQPSPATKRRNGCAALSPVLQDPALLLNNRNITLRRKSTVSITKST